MEQLIWQLQRNPVATGIVGTVSSLGASALSFFQHLELIIRIFGGCLGICVGLFTLALQIHAWRHRKHRSHNDG